MSLDMYMWFQLNDGIDRLFYFILAHAESWQHLLCRHGYKLIS